MARATHPGVGTDPRAVGADDCRAIDSPAFSFAAARPEDDAGIRRLLRESIMPGAIALSFEREPNYFAAAHAEGGQHQTMVCRDAAGTIIGVATRVVRETFLEGVPSRTGYLAQLRLAHAHLGSFHLVTRGFRLLKQWHERDASTSVYLTSILDSNRPAQRLLESGRRGIPIYRPIDRFETSILTRARVKMSSGVTIRNATAGEEPTLASFLNACNTPYQFAPVCSSERLRTQSPLGFTMDRFLIAERAGTIIACAALWDQRAFKQNVVRGYAPWLQSLRPVINVVGRPLGRPTLPAISRPLALQYLYHAACAPGHEDAFAGLLSMACARCTSEGCSLVTGFASRHTLAPVVSRFPRRTLASTLYAVSWPDGDEQALRLTGATVHTEVALL